jgi:hypothetical protein
MNKLLVYSFSKMEMSIIVEQLKQPLNRSSCGGMLA